MAVQEGINILFQRRLQYSSMELAALFYQYSSIEAKNGNFKSALYYLDLAGQVETYILSQCAELKNQENCRL